MTSVKAAARPAAAAKPSAKATTPSLSAALASAGKRADALLAKLDKNKDGFINEAELEPMMKKLEKITDRMDQDGGDDIDLDSAAGRNALASTRKNMNDADRTLMAVAQVATEKIGEGNVERVAVKDLAKGVRDAHKSWVKMLTAKTGGIEGALGMMFAGLLLPDDVLKAALKK